MLFKKMLLPVMAVLVLCLCSCNDEDTMNYSSVIKNTELVNILKAKGYTFSEEGKLELNDLAMSTEKLDLSGTNLKDFSGLEMLPNLKEVKLSKNGYGPVFDFGKLPAQITAVDLTENEIYDFEGLVDYTFENGEITVKESRNFTKLYLPESSRYNVEDLVPYYIGIQQKKQNVDLQMADETGKLSVYNTIRRIPDVKFSQFLKSKYPSVFVDEQSIDISKPAKLEEHHVDLFFVGEPEFEGMTSIEGVEYFVNNPFYPAFSVQLVMEKEFKTSYLMPGRNIKILALKSVNTPKGIDLKKATSLYGFASYNNNGIKTLDMTNTLVGNQPTKDFDPMFANSIMLHDCPGLEEVKLNSKGIGDMDIVEFVNLPKLKSLDFSNLVSMGTSFYLITLPNCDITYPTNLKRYFSSGSWKWYELSDKYQISFCVSQDVLDKESTRDFIKGYGKFLSDDYQNVMWTFMNYKWAVGNGPTPWKQ